MADVSVKMGVSGLQQFKNSMKDAEASVKTLDAAIKSNEKSAKVYGQTESYLSTQTNLLNAKLKEQKNVAKAAEQALRQMEANGVRTTSAAYQNMQRKMIEANTAMLDTEEQIRNLGAASVEASGQTDQLASSLGGLNKKVSLEQVTSAIGSITSGLEKAGKKAAEVGKLIWENITDSARWADDAATSAMILNMDVEDYQKYKKVFDQVGEITVQEWQKAKTKVQSAINKPTDEQTNILSLLGISTHEMKAGKYGMVQGAARDFEDVFWEIGETLRRKVETGELTQDLADTYANAIFGKSFANLNPMFALGREGFAAALEEQVAASKEAVEANAKLNDELIRLQGDFETLKQEVLAGLTPALTGAAETLDSLLGRLIEYLKSDDGKKALEDMSKAVEGLFTDLSTIDPEKVVEGFSKVFTDIVGGLQWLTENKETVIDVLKAVVEGWGVLKLAGGALEVYKLIQGVLGLTGGAAATAAAAGSAAGASWGAAFASAVTVAAAATPWLVFLYTLLHPSGTGNNDLADANGLTAEGWQDFLTQRERASNGYTQDNVWYDLIMQAGEIVEAAANLWDDPAGIQALAQYAIDNDKEKLAANLQALGYVLRVANEDLIPELEGTEYTGGREGVFRKDRNGKLILPIDPETPFFTVEDIEVPAELKTPEDEDEKVAEQVGTVTIPTLLEFRGWTPDGVPDIPTFGGAGGHGFGYDEGGESGGHGFANGIWSVPFDGMRAILHKGERVVPAREVSGSRNFSSNLYVENMNMSGGMDADALAARISAANRRTMAGWG